jgi:hypothetical protein
MTNPSSNPSSNPSPNPDTHIIHHIPLAEIDSAALTRDRSGLDAEPLNELKTSRCQCYFGR